MDGRPLADLAVLRALPGEGGCQLCDGPTEPSLTGAEGEADRSKGQVLLIPPAGDSGKHL